MKPYLLLAVLLWGGSVSAPSQTTTNAPVAAKLQMVRVEVLRSDWETNSPTAENRIEMGDWLRVEVESPSEPLARAITDKKPIALFLNQVPLKGLYYEVSLMTNATALTNNTVARFRFHLEWTDASRTNWTALLRKPHLRSLKFAVGVGSDDGACLTDNTGGNNHLKFDPLSSLQFGFWSLLWIAFVIAFALLWVNSELLRDSGPDPAGKALRPYSLARTQMAIWFFLVISAFIFLRLVMGSAFIPITATILALIGIAAGTALGAEVQDNSKLAKLQSEKIDLEKLDKSNPAVWTNEKRDRLAELTRLLTEIRAAPVSQGFIEDILTDEVGISFHRFQMAVWTFVLACIFVIDVYKNLAMPEFSDTLLGLMGISSGTYLGFMMTEKHSSEEQKK